MGSYYVFNLLFCDVIAIHFTPLKYMTSDVVLYCVKPT